MIKSTYFASRPSEGWLEHYFLDPPEQRRFFETGNDSAGLTAEGADGTEQILPKVAKDRPRTTAEWSRDDYLIEAYWDEPKTLEELQRAVAAPKRGYDIRHIVEQTSAEQDGFARSVIDGADNLVRISRLKHWEITGWYMTKNEDYNGFSPRNYLRGKVGPNGREVAWMC